MYRCEKCSSVVPPKSTEIRLLLETRPIAHPPRKHANPRKAKMHLCADCKESEMKHRHLDHPFRSPADDPGGKGWAIVREARVCRACFDAEQARQNVKAA